MAKVLVVDDALFMRRMLSDILKKEGIEICGEAENGKDAIEKYQQLKPDLVTMDIVMPKIEEIDGIGAVKEIVKNDANAKIIMVSAMGQEAMVRDAVLNGAKGFIVKPFKEDGILAAISKLV